MRLSFDKIAGRTIFLTIDCGAGVIELKFCRLELKFLGITNFSTKLTSVE